MVVALPASNSPFTRCDRFTSTFTTSTVSLPSNPPATISKATGAGAATWALAGLAATGTGGAVALPASALTVVVGGGGAADVGAGAAAVPAAGDEAVPTPSAGAAAAVEPDRKARTQSAASSVQNGVNADAAW